MPAARFDHVAFAGADRARLWDLLAGDLGGRWAGGGDSLGGFSFGQLRYANAMKVEVLEPLAGGSDFLARFLATTGAGPHHLTFTVGDLGAALDEATQAGYQPLGVSLDDPRWQEAFLHPRQATGIVVQLACTSGEPDGPAPADLPVARRGDPAELVHVAHAVTDLDAALRLFKGLLGGQPVDAGAGGGLGWVDLAWPGPERPPGAGGTGPERPLRAGGTGPERPLRAGGTGPERPPGAGDIGPERPPGAGGTGPGRLRLLAGAPVVPWVGGRPGRLHALCVRVDDPAAMPGAVAHADWWEVAPAPPLGVRLVLIGRDAPVPPPG